MQNLQISADELMGALLRLSETKTVAILDSCGVSHLGSHLLIAGIEPVETCAITNEDPAETLEFINEKLATKCASIFTLSYDLGLKLQGIEPSQKQFANIAEPDLFLSTFDVLIVHDYDTGETKLCGDRDKCALEADNVMSAADRGSGFFGEAQRAFVRSNFTRDEYIGAVEVIQERIRSGDTYQANLTQQLTAELPDGLSPQTVFYRLRRDHPAPFAAFIQRGDSTVISASPERFFRFEGKTITTSPIKGTRPRGKTVEEDTSLRTDLLTSIKDRAENTMIVDLLRNDLGRVCEYASVEVEKLCDIEEHPTLFHLVSTVDGELRDNIKPSDIIKALFPCGSITGAPKISTMGIIDEIETATRGLSMGAIGICIPDKFPGLDPVIDLSVAIRTMVVRENSAVFNVGGGIVIDSDPEKEYDESLTKAKALLNAIGGDFP